MKTIVEQTNQDLLIYIGTIGILLAFLFLFFYLYRRLCWILSIFNKKSENSKKKTKNPGLIKSIKNLVFIIMWSAVFGMILFSGLFFRAYSAFTYEEPVAKIITQTLKEEQSTLVKLIHLQPDMPTEQNFLIKGDQWMLEGDILKWENWINFMGFHTRYRLTRIRGRYNDVNEEINKSPSIYAINNKIDESKWKYLYRYGDKLPFVNTVYGNAVFQNNDSNNQYLIYVSNSGFVVKKIKKED